MKFTAKDIMQTHVITVGVDDPLMSVYRLFTDEEISGAPVVNERGELEGIITLRDLVRDHRAGEDAAGEDNVFFQGESLDDGHAIQSTDRAFTETLISRTASDVMSQGIISVDPEMPVSEVAEILIVHRIHRVLVLEKAEGGRCLMGIISLFDLVELLT